MAIFFTIVIALVVYRLFYYGKLNRLVVLRESAPKRIDKTVIILLQLLGFVHRKSIRSNYQVVRNSKGGLSPLKMVVLYVLTVLVLLMVIYIVGSLSIYAALALMVGLFLFHSTYIAPQLNLDLMGCLAYILFVPFGIVVTILFFLLGFIFPELEVLMRNNFEQFVGLLLVPYLLLFLPSYKIWTEVDIYNRDVS